MPVRDFRRGGPWLRATPLSKIHRAERRIRVFSLFISRHVSAMILNSTAFLPSRSRVENNGPSEIGSIAEVWMNLAKTGFGGYLSFQEQWLALLKSNMPGLDSSSSHAWMKDVFKAWGDFYEKGVRQFVTAPPVGLTRYHQERMAELLDKFSQFQTKMAQFLSLLVVPMDRSIEGMREAMEALPRNGDGLTETRECYQTWLKMLEGYYIALFNSDEYTGTLNSTMEALEEFTVARQKFVEAFLRVSFIPTSTDFDDLSREVYLLKKRVKELTKKLEEK